MKNTRRAQLPPRELLLYVFHTDSGDLSESLSCALFDIVGVMVLSKTYTDSTLALNTLATEQGTLKALKVNRIPMEQKNTLMGILSYLGPLVIVPLLTSKDDPFVKFHIKQGLVLLVIEAVAWAVGMVMWQLWFFIPLINLFTLIMSIMGIVNVVQGKQEKLPLIGQYGEKFTI